MDLKELLKQKKVYVQTLKMIEKRKIMLINNIEEIDSKIRKLSEGEKA